MVIVEVRSNIFSEVITRMTRIRKCDIKVVETYE